MPVAKSDALGFWLIGPGLALFLSGVTIAGLGLAPLPILVVMIAAGATLTAGYVRHALQVPSPLVDLRLLRFATFRISTVGGTFFRLGGGALPFLLPLMFQIGFGLSAFQSGMMTFASGLGAIAMKFIAQPILRHFGFRKVLSVNAVFSAALLFAPAWFSPQTPYLIMVGTLFVGGICRSLQFTSINAMTYSEIEPGQMSSATSFNSVMQHFYGGTSIDLAHFPPVSAMLALLSLSSGKELLEHNG